MPLRDLPAGLVMPVGEMVDAALTGLDLGEFATIPSLPDIADWDAFEAARRKLMPHLSHAHPAARYRARPGSPCPFPRWSGPTRDYAFRRKPRDGPRSLSLAGSGRMRGRNCV